MDAADTGPPHNSLQLVIGSTHSCKPDHLHDERSDSIGALLAHIAAVEHGFRLVTFEEREPTAEEHDTWSAALKLGDKGRRDIRDHELPHYIDDLRRIREVTLRALAARDDVARGATARRSTA